MIASEHTRTIVSDELDGAAAWAGRHGAKLDWAPEGLELRVTLVQCVSGAPFHLRGRFRDYRALPPEWTFTDEAWQRVGHPGDFPKGVQSSFGATIFILHEQHAVICVPFSRLAYVDGGGPHKDWGGPANWLNAGPTHIHADTIGDMLQAIHRDFLLTRERMANS